MLKKIIILKSVKTLGCFGFCLIFLSLCYGMAFANVSSYKNAPLDIEDFLEKDQSLSLSGEKIKLSDVLKDISQKTGLNFIASEKAGEKLINIYINDVPLPDAFKRILSANNLVYEINPDSHIIVVNDRDEISQEITTQVYKLKYASLEASKTNIPSRTEDKKPAESGITAAIKTILSPQGSVIEDIRTNSLIITDMRKNFDMIEKTIQDLDVRVPQILIEVEMVDISKSTADILNSKFSNSVSMFQAPEPSIGFKSSLLPRSKYQINTLSPQSRAFIMQYLNQKEDTNILARPRLMTLNNETAKVEIKTDEAIGLSHFISASQGKTNSVTKAERTDTGIFLTITPQANLRTNEITLALEPKVIQTRQGETFRGHAFKDPEERGAKTVLRIKDGDTIIMGGLLKTSSEKTRKRHIISNIPLLGKRMKEEPGSDERELVIFITPTIIDDKNPSREARLSANHFGGIIREQNIPNNDRLREINAELKHFEN